ncbi:unnamed protein product [Paramecium primaurelia]|uniref:MICOS complex subunit MIC10 n=2 Tax=Paramecium TaxID=5884 RepID=A0A8S1UGK3_9CILI|nr:unnamed protein product [Paramecium primaurelia]CAD8163725.1 unnamed protein product [Paramecium pentaurelia]
MTEQNKFTLGQSAEVLQYTEQQVQDADILLNRLLVKSFTYTSAGLFSGSLLSIFFKNKVGVIGYSAGIGLGLALHQYSNGLFDTVRRQI